MTVTVTINEPEAEWEEEYKSVTSLDTLLSSLKLIYPSATSFVFVFRV